MSTIQLVIAAKLYRCGALRCVALRCVGCSEIVDEEERKKGIDSKFEMVAFMVGTQ